MKQHFQYTLLLALLVFTIKSKAQQNKLILLKNVNLIDGTGSVSKPNVDILIKDGNIAAIRSGLKEPAATQIDLKGKTIIPAIISAHTHIGTLKGNTSTAENYTRENVLRQLKRYQDYGVGTILTMGTDRPLIFEGLIDSIKAGLLPGARLYSAGYGFNTPEKAPGSWMNLLLRPESPEQVPAQIEQLAKVKPTVVKIWVDDHGGKADKMKPEIYKAIITEAHKKGIRVASHLYNLEDARDLTASGLDIMAHSIRDKEIDADLLKSIKAKGVAYIPTLSLDEYAFVYARKPEWIEDPFFKASLEPGVYEMIISTKYQDQVKNSPDYERNMTGFKMALKNLKKIHDAGILVALGTDSGAFPIRAQGFSEHLEMELMVQAGLTPMQTITAATLNSAKILKIDNLYGTLEKGKKADFIVLTESPEKNIKNTRKIESVWKDGRKVSDGPLKK
ncbi:amidohydrolase family protein [Dyadobacter frigoris]|uniref:Amidohydrolase n=1 Tax=Dyadobacter frigoris TaxID=2576211 RepID=A0A4U6CZ50_9BACT|nr:amidohydrolase family protein [Dyadobacter frigoris]TKT90140.1 amidohydrolase [Dyadobacter frigoris]GLU52369.1 amidohydrolase [Dyadobacter frigoris]